MQAGVFLLGGYEHSVWRDVSQMTYTIRETELLDVAPIDFFNGMLKRNLQFIPMLESQKAYGLDVEWHWVSESGKPGHLSSGAVIETVVS